MFHSTLENLTITITARQVLFTVVKLKLNKVHFPGLLYDKFLRVTLSRKSLLILSGFYHNLFDHVFPAYL